MIRNAVSHTYFRLSAVFLVGAVVAVIAVFLETIDRPGAPLALASDRGAQCLTEDSIAEDDEDVYFVSCGGFF